ncbi:hypothetical protein FACS1894200_12900 [Spirochaetia bacterium]|nr:hypothetical protein FACS1894200_12900 [Spirochaetia bacterium]
MHIVRHKVGFECFVSTQRNDRQDNFDREKAPQDNPVDMVIYCNAEALITFLQKRLCNNAGKDMVSVALEIKYKVLEVTPELEEMAVPPCVLYNRCMEMEPCGRMGEF